MTDNYVLALEKDRDTRLAELERCRSEVERFVGEVDRLTRERDQNAEMATLAARAGAQLAAEKDGWKARAEAAEAETARLEEWCTSLREENDSVRRKEAALLERLRAAEVSARAWEEQCKQTERLRRAQGDRLDAAVAVVEASRPLADGHPMLLGRIELRGALAAYDATKEGKVTIVTTTPAYQGTFSMEDHECSTCGERGHLGISCPEQQ